MSSKNLGTAPGRLPTKAVYYAFGNKVRDGVLELRPGVALMLFFAETPADERKILTAFLEFAASQPSANFLAFSASKFEERVLHRRLSFHGPSTSVYSRLVNACHTFQQSVALPIDSEKVKDVAETLGLRYRHSELDGFGVALLYERNYIGAKNAARKKALKRKLLEYNEDDVRSLPFILDAVANLSHAVNEFAAFPLKTDRAARDEPMGVQGCPKSNQPFAGRKQGLTKV